MSQHPFIKHLLQDHDKQRSLGKQLVDTSSADERKTLREEFYDALYPHMVGEEASFFSDLRNSNDQDVKDDALEGLQEHHVAKIVLRELMDMSTEGDLFKAKAKVLDELNRHHLEEEEEDIFPYLQKNFSADELDSLFKRYEAAEDKAKS